MASHSQVKRGRIRRPHDIEVLQTAADQLMDRETPSAYRDAMRYLRKAAAAGDTWSQYHLGLIHHHGLNGRKSLRQAIKWYELAAARGDSSAQVNLGNVLANLPGKRRDLRRATELYRRAARQGNRNAAYNLGMYYATGRGVKKNLKTAIHWYQQAAEQGDKEARVLLKHLRREVAGTTRSRQQRKDQHRNRPARRCGVDA
jgi:TPR repeat protein